MPDFTQIAADLVRQLRDNPDDAESIVVSVVGLDLMVIEEIMKLAVKGLPEAD